MADTARYRQLRRRLVDDLRRRGILSSPEVTRAMKTVPRHEFVPPAQRARAYADEPLPIGGGQVITAPHLVAPMTELLDLRPGQTVLEIGTGSGYHAAVIAAIVGPENVYTIERLPELAETAKKALERSGYGDVTVILGDGSRGLPQHAPFERINVTSVAGDIPRPFIEQLADGGKMVIPLGPRGGTHKLMRVTKQRERIERSYWGAVRFVPLIGEHGFGETR